MTRDEICYLVRSWGGSAALVMIVVSGAVLLLYGFWGFVNLVVDWLTR